MTTTATTTSARGVPSSVFGDPAFWWAALAYSLFSANEVLTKWLYVQEPHLGGLSVAFLRTVFAALTFTMLVLVNRERLPAGPGAWRAVLLFGVSSAASTYCFNASLTYLDYPATGAAIITMSPLILGIFGSIRLRRALSTPEWAALILGACGVGIFFADSLLRERGALGIVLMLVSALLWSIYPAFAGPRGSTLGMYAAVFWVGTALLGAVSLPTLGMPQTIPGWLALAVLGIFILGISTFGCVKAFALPGGLRWAKLNYAKPAISVLLTLLVFGAAPTAENLAGTLVITLALLLPTIWQRVRR